MTVEQWAALPEDEGGELVDGRLVEEEMPDYAHDACVTWLVQWFAWVVARGGFVFGSEWKHRLAANRGRKSDASVFLPGSKKPPRRGASSVPPDIAIEVISPTPRDARRDRVEKLREYAAFGVAYYWLVDPGTRALEILALDRGEGRQAALDAGSGRYYVAVAASEGVTDVPGCTGVVLDLDALWAEIDRLGADE